MLVERRRRRISYAHTNPEPCSLRFLRSAALCAVFVATALLSVSAEAYKGMPTPKLHVSGRYLQDPSGKNVLLHGYMQPGASWFNGYGQNFTDPTDYTSPSNVAGMLNFYNAVLDIMSQSSGQYGRLHGWQAGFVRLCGNGNAEGFAPGWDSNGQLSNPAQFQGYIQNLLVPYANHAKSVGMYLVITGTPSQAYPGGDGTKNMGYQFQQNLITFWRALASAPGLKSADNVIFEINNEPVTIESHFGANDWGGGSPKYWSALKSFMQPIVDEIRNQGADNIILMTSLGWQGENQGYASYPVDGTNIAYSGHYYPAYGGVKDDATKVQNLWNSNYKPIADIAPLFITEMWWNPNDGEGYKSLWNASTAGFGNAVKSAIDNQGNVSYLVGMVGDLFDNLEKGLSTATFPTGEGAAATFEWWSEYLPNEPMVGALVADGTYKIVARHSGQVLDAAGQGTTNGTQITQWPYWCGENQKWTVINRGNNQYSIIGVQSGRALEVSNFSTANGAKVQLWDYLGAASQKFVFAPTSGGYYRIIPVHAPGMSVDVAFSGMDNGTPVQLWSWIGSQGQEFALQSP